MGHLFGLDDFDPGDHADDVMSAVLEVGHRRLPWSEAVDEVLARGLD
jgi:hypothetical protein